MEKYLNYLLINSCKHLANSAYYIRVFFRSKSVVSNFISECFHSGETWADRPDIQCLTVESMQHLFLSPPGTVSDVILPHPKWSQSLPSHRRSPEDTGRRISVSPGSHTARPLYHKEAGCTWLMLPWHISGWNNDAKWHHSWWPYSPAGFSYLWIAQQNDKCRVRPNEMFWLSAFNQSSALIFIGDNFLDNTANQKDKSA